MSEKIKVGLLTNAGGAHVGAYLQALAETEECGEVALADPDGKWDAEAKRVLGDRLAGVFRDPAKLLAERKPGLALVTMEAKLTPPIIDAALNADCHVFAEKPACVDWRDFEPLVAKADSKHRYLMLALANRLNPETLAARRMIAAGTIGKIYGLELHLIADQTRLKQPSYHEQWFAQKARAGGGHLIWLGIHWLDLAMFITAASIAETSGFIANVGGQPIDTEDSAAAVLRFENGTLGTFTSGYYLDKGYHSHIKIWGSAGWLRVEAMQENPLTWYTTQGEQAGTEQTFKEAKEPRGYTPFVQAAVRACADMSDPPISNAESLRALKTVFAIYQSAATGKVVRV